MKVAIRLIAVSLLILGFVAVAAAKKKHESLATVNFVVVRDENGKPIRNAAVVLHPVGDDGKQERAGYELKTDPREGPATTASPTASSASRCWLVALRISEKTMTSTTPTWTSVLR
jgi:hypothetical protein